MQLCRHEKRMTSVILFSWRRKREHALFGRIFNYGDVRVDAAGKWDIDSNGIKNPKGLKAYLEQHTVKSENAVKMING